MEKNKWTCVALYVLVCCFRTSNADNGQLIAKLVARIDALERKVQGHETLINEQRAELGDLRSVVQEQKEELLEHEATIKDLTQWKLAQLKGKTSEQQIDDEGSTKQPEFPSLTSKAGQVERNLLGLRRNNRIVMDGEGPVAFHAVIPSGETPNLGQNQKIVFDHVNINLGGGYHNLHGLFIAPVSGIYIFSTSILSFNSHREESLVVAIMKNGSILGAAYANSATGKYEQGSISIVTQLAVGDEVWVNHRRGSTESIWGDYYSSFMGCLIFQM